MVNMFDQLNFTIDTIYQEIINKLKEDQRINEISAQLPGLSQNHEKVLYTYRLLKEYHLLPLIIKVDKSDDLSVTYRNLGNGYYEEREYYLAWQYYNLAMCFAPIPSENYAIALSNRSAVFANLKKYDESMKDMFTAFSKNCPKRIHNKLMNRMGLCKAALDNERVCPTDNKNKEIDDILTLKGPKHDTYVNSSSKLSVVYSEEQGRHVVANTDIEVGEVIVQEKPFVMQLLKSQYFFACSYCFSRNPNLYPCPLCCFSMYCGSSCSQKAWVEYHCYECNIMACLIKMNFTKLELLALRNLLKARRIHKDWANMIRVIKSAEVSINTSNRGHENVNGEWVYDSQYYSSIHTLETNAAKRDVSDMFQKCVSSAVLLYILSNVCFLQTDDLSLKQEIKEVAASAILNLIMAAPTNMHGISTNVENDEGNYIDEYDIGCAPYAFLSLINHSCSPNVVRVSKLGSGVMTLVALRPIKKGMQILDNYGYAEEIRDENQMSVPQITFTERSKRRKGIISLTTDWQPGKQAHHAVSTKEERQKILKSQYKFTCLCEACTGDWPLYYNLSFVPNLPQDIVEKLKILDEDAIESLQRASKKIALKLFRPLCELATALEPYIPCKEAANCQEILKQCLVIFGGVISNGYSKIAPWCADGPLPSLITACYYNGDGIKDLEN